MKNINKRLFRFGAIISFLLCFSFFSFKEEPTHNNFGNFHPFSASFRSKSKTNREIESDEIRGIDNLVLAGTIKGKNVTQTASSYHLNFDDKTKRYSGVFDFDKDDFFSVYMQKKGTYICYLKENEDAKHIYDSAGLTHYLAFSRENFYVNYSGTYEISISGAVENLSFPTDIWKDNSNSYIKFLGKNNNSIYVFLGERSLGSNYVFTEGNTSIRQYGYDGSFIEPIECLKANCGNGADGAIIRISYDSLYSNSFTLKSVIGDDVVTTCGNFETSRLFTCYESITSTGLDKACDFCAFVADSMNNIEFNSENFKDFNSLDFHKATEMLHQYKKMSKSEISFLDNLNISVYFSENQTERISIKSFVEEVREYLKHDKQYIFFFLYIAGSSILALIILYLFLSYKASLKSDELPKNIAKSSSFYYLEI